MMYTKTYTSPIGQITLAGDGDSLKGLWIEGQKYDGTPAAGDAAVKDDLRIFSLAADWLDRYFAGENPSVGELSLMPKGSDFQREVWDLLLDIPYGTVVTYSDIARDIESRKASGKTYSRAVGGAVGRNPISIIIPCHRVIGSDGSLTGYAGGVDIKAKLLELEGITLKL